MNRDFPYLMIEALLDRKSPRESLSCFCAREPLPVISNHREPGEKSREVPKVRRTVVSKQVPLTAEDVKWKEWSSSLLGHLLVSPTSNSNAKNYYFRCGNSLWIRSHTFMLRLYLKCFLMVIFIAKNGVVCSSLSKSNITIILGYFYRQLDENV